LNDLTLFFLGSGILFSLAWWLLIDANIFSNVEANNIPDDQKVVFYFYLPGIACESSLKRWFFLGAVLSSQATDSGSGVADLSVVLSSRCLMLPMLALSYDLFRLLWIAFRKSYPCSGRVRLTHPNSHFRAFASSRINR
jgi:hypothetical protein